jgi:hypothetical protein
LAGTDASPDTQPESSGFEPGACGTMRDILKRCCPERCKRLEKALPRPILRNSTRVRYKKRPIRRTLGEHQGSRPGAVAGCDHPHPVLPAVQHPVRLDDARRCWRAITCSCRNSPTATPSTRSRSRRTCFPAGSGRTSRNAAMSPCSSLPSNTKIDYIKRVSGFPGDRIQVTDGSCSSMVRRSSANCRQLYAGGTATARARTCRSTAKPCPTG